MIDLHLHTTASDGRSAPDALVGEAVSAGCRAVAVTDHDTTAAIEPVRVAAERVGVEFVPGIEMTAVDRARDIHVLGYGIDPADETLAAFLAEQRTIRRERIASIAQKLADLGVPVDLDAVVEAAARSGRSLGRPAVAAALVSAGHVRDVQDAFDRFLAEGQPAHVPREGASPLVIVGYIRRAGGVASLAHAGKYHRDDLIAPMVAAGMEAIEVYHPDHQPADVERYLQAADRYGLLVTGGSDYHGPGSGRSDALGRVGLPEAHYRALIARLARADRHGR
jgi:predicted metal-dependent phosphoesterase TrpH